MKQAKRQAHAHAEQFQDCGECIFCGRDIPINSLQTHQKRCFANEDADKYRIQEMDQIIKEYDLDFNLNTLGPKQPKMKFNPQIKYEVDLLSSEEIKKQPGSLKSIPSYSEKFVKKQSLGSGEDLIPCQNCSNQFHFQQIMGHQQNCLQYPKMLYESCQFCGQPYPQDSLNIHVQSCQIRLELERQTQFFNKKSQTKEQAKKQIKNKKLTVTTYTPPKISLSSKAKQMFLSKVNGNNDKKIQTLEKNNSKIQNSTIRQVKKIERSSLKAEATQCAICFVEIQRNNRIYNLKCDHKFHKSCLDPWLENSDKCPMCKKIAQTN